MVGAIRAMLVAVVVTWFPGVAAGANAPGAADGVLDAASVSPSRSIPTPRGLEYGAPWTITCFDYPGYRVKQLSGEGQNVAVVSTQILRSGVRVPVCGAQDDPGEKVISRETFSLVGARGGFVLLGLSDSPLYLIYDAASGKQVYKDTVSDGKVLSFQVAGDVATMAYVRRVSAPCSLVTGGAACWQRLVRETRLPAEVAQMGPPLAACETAFRTADPSLQVTRDVPNVVTYEATVTFDRGGHSTVLSRAHLGCSYDP